MSYDDFLNKKITIKEGLNMGIISGRVLSDVDIFIRVQSIMEKENIPKSHAVEILAEKCKVSESTVWRSYSFTSKIMKVE